MTLVTINAVLTRLQRYALINANLERLGQDYVRMRTQWTVVYPPAGRQLTVGPPAPAIPDTRGIIIFMPNDAMASPVYIFVNYIDGKRIRVRTDVSDAYRANGSS